ncbi:MAG: MATE family efflux transporter [Deltaproteobacteria bacterium]|nr:MATE family efflux transporter [Deltaproteobacteria bacterium]
MKNELLKTLRLALPIIINQFGQFALQLTDSIMVGRVGVASLGAFAFAHSVLMILLVFGSGLLFSVGVLTARAFGANHPHRGAEILRHGILLAAVTGTLFALLIQVGVPWISFFDQPREVTEMSVDYFVIVGWSMVPALIYIACRQFCEGLSQSLMPMYITLGAISDNAFFNWILIFGHWGAPALGLKGAAIATLAVRIAIIPIILLMIMKHPTFARFRPSHWFAKFQKRVTKDLLKIGIPAGLQTIFEAGAFSFAAIMMGWLGTTPLAAHQIALNYAITTFMFAMGISFATSIRVGQAAGRNDLAAVRQIGQGSLLLVLFVMGICGVIFILFRNQLPLIYLHDPSIVQLTALLLIFAGVFQIADGVQAVAAGALRGLADVKIPTIITFVAYWCISIPSGYLFGFVFGWDGAGIWLGLVLGLFTNAILLTIRFFIFARPAQPATELILPVPQGHDRN